MAPFIVILVVAIGVVAVSSGTTNRCISIKQQKPQNRMVYLFIMAVIGVKKQKNYKICYKPLVPWDQYIFSFYIYQKNLF
jgi:hypothetical protein